MTPAKKATTEKKRQPGTAHGKPQLAPAVFQVSELRQSPHLSGGGEKDGILSTCMPSSAPQRSAGQCPSDQSCLYAGPALHGSELSKKSACYGIVVRKIDVEK